MLHLLIFKSISLPHLTLQKLAEYGLHVVGALVILVVGWIIANLLSRWLKKWLTSKEKFDSTLAPIISDTLKIVILAITFIMVLTRFGVQTASLIAIIGSIGIGVGLALQGTLSDIASGLMLLSLRPFNAGDAVHINGEYGVIDKIGLFITEMHTYNGVYMTMPNSKIWKNKIQNYSRNDSRRISLTFRIHRDSDMDKALSIVEEEARNDERVLAEPELYSAISNLDENSVEVLLRPWTAPGDWWQTQLALRKRIKERFDEEGIIIPYPQRDLHFPEQNGKPAESNKEVAK